MPAEIWGAEIRSLSHEYHVIALDPRSQGESQETDDGNFPQRRAQDIKDLVDDL
jgi:non-heme chloroperoxidase